jgi:protein O-GlcNAc transferase
VAGYFLNLGLVSAKNGLLDQAIAHYQKAALLDPVLKSLQFWLGNAFMQQGKFSEAASCYARELQVSPESYPTITNLGNALRKLGRHEQAITCYQKAISLQLSHPDRPSNLGVTFSNLGLTYNDLGRLDEAIASYREAIRRAPKFVDPHINLVQPLIVQGRLEEALQIAEQAVALQPDHWCAHLSLGNVYRELGRLSDAAASFERAVSLTTDNGGAYNNLGMVSRDQGKLKQAANSFEKAVAARPIFKAAYSNLLYFYAFTRYVTPAEERKVAEQWEAYFLTSEERAGARKRTFPLRPRSGRKLRLGVVTAEWFPHPVAQFLEPWLEVLDRNRFELTIFPTLFTAGPLVQRLRDFAERNGDSIIPLWGISAVPAADLIRSKRIDVLIETTGHTHANRLEVIAHRAAPVQCTYLGYWGTTGLTEMDWFITAAGVGSFVDPHFTEGMWRLPRFAVAYQRDDALAESGWTPSPDGTVWLGSFNTNAKMREETLALWAKVLHALPEAKLLFEDAHVQEEETHQRLLSTLLGFGVNESRVVFIPYVRGHERHMKLYDRLDIALDTIPFNSGTTAFDALWMGVPLITLAGNWLGGIMAAITLEALGHPEWIAHSEAEYVSIVCSLARDVEKRKQLRKSQRPRMANSQLCDVVGLARCLEDAFEAMYDRWAAGTAQQTERTLLATARITQAVKKEASTAGYFVALGIALETNGEWEEAIAHYRQAVDLDPNMKFAHFRLANALMKQEKFSEAAAAYSQELRLSPESAETIHNLGIALEKLGRPEPASR